MGGARDEARQELVVGCHLSIAKGYAAIGRKALSLGATTFSYFTRNPRGGAVREPEYRDVAALLCCLDEHGMGPVVAHAPYTLNLCSPKPDVVTFGRRILSEDVRRMESLPGNYLNLHPGSHVGQGVDEGVRLIAKGLDAAIEPGLKTQVLLETMAGKGSEVGRSFEEIERILERASIGDELGVCLDTCHVWDAGYDVVGDLEGVLAEFDRVIGLERLKALHLNDSKNPLGSHKDRHERLGRGMMGLSLFEAIVTHPRLSRLPMILETPNDEEGYARELALLRTLAKTEE